MKKLTAIALMLILIVGLAACNGGTPTQTAQPTSAATAGAGSATDGAADPEEPGGATEGPFGKYDPPIEISWAVSTSAVQQFKDGDTYDDNIWSRLFLDRLGIQLRVAFTADGSTDAFNNKMNMQLAAGDLPDIIKGSGYTFFKQAYDAGYLADITDVFDEYASDYLKECDENYSSFGSYPSIDGRRYGLGSFNDTRADAQLLWIRDDWLENTGKEAPTTMEELYELAYAFTYEDPDGDGQNNTFGLGLNNGLLTTNYCTLLGFVGSYGIPGMGHSLFYRNDEGNMTFPYIEPGMKDALAYVQKLYADGIIDPEFSVKDAATLEGDIAEGKIGMAFGMQWGTWLPWNIVWQNEGVKTRAYPIPEMSGVTPKMGVGNPAGGNITAISASCEHPEALIKIANVFMDTYNVWADPETSRIYIEDEQYRFSPVVLTEPQEPVWGPMLEEALKRGTSDGLADRLLSHYEKVSGFEDGTNTGSDAYGLWGQYNIGASVPIIMNEYVPKGYIVQNIIGVEQPQSFIDYNSVLEAITLQAFTEIIMGADINTFDQYVQDWLGAGGQAILDELEGLYPAS